MQTELKRKTSGQGTQELRKRSTPKRVKVGILANAGRYPTVSRTERDEVDFLGGEVALETFEQKPRIASVARWNCEGTEKIPQRDFLTATVQTRLTFYRRFMYSLLKAMLLGRITPKRALGTLGLRARNDMVNTVTNWTMPPNSSRTAKRKGRNDPLVDTGLMRDKISWKVDNEQ